MKKKEKKIIVFGASGFLGSHVADALTEHGYKVKLFDMRESPYLRPGQEMIVDNILHLEKVKDATEGCHIVFNFAGLADIDEAHYKPVETATSNVIGTLHTLEAARHAKVERYVFASSVYVYSERGSFYRTSKQAAERFIETYQEVYDLDYTILRYGSLYGRRADKRNMIFKLLHDALSGNKMVYPGTGNELRDYIHVSDAAEASVQILEKKYANQHIILTGNEKMKVKDLLKMISEIMNGKVEYCFSNEEAESHYMITPYSFNPKIGRKLVNTFHIDMGQGLLDCLAEIHKKIESEMQPEVDWLIEDKSSVKNKKNKSV